MSPTEVGPSGTILIILGKPKPSQQGVNSPPFQLVLVRLGVTDIVGVILTVGVGVGVGGPKLLIHSLLLQPPYKLPSHVPSAVAVVDPPPI